MIGCLLKFDAEKRSLYNSLTEYPQFHDQVGLCVSHTVREDGQEFVAVQWLKPIKYHNQMTVKSHFAAYNFIVVGAVHEK